MVAGIFGWNYPFCICLNAPLTERSGKSIFFAPSLRPDQAKNMHLGAYLMLEIE